MISMDMVVVADSLRFHASLVVMGQVDEDFTGMEPLRLTNLQC